jgi:hypothetical protein
MTSNNSEPTIIRSTLCQDVIVDGYRFSVNIFATVEYPGWSLEVVDMHGMSHVWDAEFETDADALEAAMIAFNDEGAAGFLAPDTNIIPFPGRAD